MSDRPKDAADETPMQRALRLKKAARETKPDAPGRNDVKRKQVAGVRAGASQPWMKK
jgi:hypothetical protein